MSDNQDPLINERETSRRTQDENPREVSLCERFLAHVGDGFNRLERPFRWEERSGTILQLATMGINSLRWASELMFKGYYVQANALSRVGWESWLHGAFMFLYPERPLEEWRNFKSRPDPKDMRRLVAERSTQLSGIKADEFRVAMTDLYSAYSNYGHPSEKALKVLIGKHNDEPWLRLGGEYDDVLVLESTNLFCTATAMLSTLLYILMPNDADYQAQGHALREELAAWRQELPK